MTMRRRNLANRCETLERWAKELRRPEELEQQHHAKYVEAVVQLFGAFRRWLAGLQDGSFGLPPRVPRQLLESFDDRYGAVLFRCCDCRCGCGNAQRLEACPVCGGELERMSLASELPKWESEGEFLARTSGKREQ